MNYIDQVKNLLKEKPLKNILIYNKENISQNQINQLLNLNKNINIFLVFKTISIQKLLSLKFKSNSNIHIGSQNLLYSILFDLIICENLSTELSDYINQIQYQTNISIINTPKKSPFINFYLGEYDLFYNYERKKLVDILTNNIKKEIKLNNTIIIQKKQQNKEKQNIIQKKQQNKNLLNNKIQNISQKNIDNYKIIVKNISTRCTKFNIKKSYNIQYGQVNLLCIIKQQKDYKKFLTTIQYFNKNYKNIKYYIFYKKENKKYIQEKDLEGLNYLIIENTQNLSNQMNKFLFQNLLFGEYKLDLNELDLSKNILELLHLNEN